MAFIPASNSVVAFQSDPTKLVGTVSVVGNINASVSGTLNINPVSSIAVNLQSTNASIITVGGGTTGNSSVTAFQGGAWSTSITGGYSNIIGSVLVTGSIAAYQGTDPWKINMPSPSVIAYQLAGSVMAVNATVNTGNSSVQILNGSAVIGSVAVLQGTDPWKINVPSPSVIAYQLAGSIMAVSATVNTGNSSVQILGGIATIGSVVSLQGTSPWIIGSVIATVQSSVAVAITNISASIATYLQSSNASVITVGGGTTGNSSVLAFQGTLPWVIQSIVGTYAEDVPSGLNDKGIFTLGVRNDTVASLVNVDGDYTGWSTDSAGRHLLKPFAPDESRLDTQISVVSTSVTALFASVTGLRNYVTDLMIANTGAATTLITLRDGSTSILGYTIAPAGGGSNIIGMNMPFRTAPGQDFAFQVSPASSILFVTAKGYRAP